MMKLNHLLLALLISISSAVANAEPMMFPMKDRPTAKNFTLPDVNGQATSLSDYQGKYVLVNFWADWCSPCVKEFPAMQTMYDTLKADNIDFEIIAIHAGPVSNDIENFLEQVNVNFKVVLDDTASLKGWKVPGLPMSYLVNPDGELVYQALGAKDWEGITMKKLITHLQ